MLRFQPITPADRTSIERYTLRGASQNCDYAFANMVCWQSLYHSEWAESEGFLLIRFRIDGGEQIGYMQPLGEGDFTPLLPHMEADAASFGQPLHLIGLTREGVARLREGAPDEWLITTDRNYYDYLYEQRALAELVGKHYQPKRNHINRFTTLYPTHRYEPLMAAHAEACLELEREWCRQREGCREGGLAAEMRAMQCAFEHFEELGLEGGALSVEERLVAFAYGSAVNQETFVVHAEKADTRFEGAFAMINRSLARQLEGRYRWINREEDLGIEGLRKAKLSYGPVALVEKYAARRYTREEIDCRNLWRACFPTDEASCIDHFLADFFDPKNLLSIEQEGTPAAMAHLIPFESELGRIGYLYALATSPAHRGKGYATELTRKAIEQAQERGYRAVVLIPGTASLRAFYDRLGFAGELPIELHSGSFDFGTGDPESDRAMIYWCNDPAPLPEVLHAYYNEH